MSNFRGFIFLFVFALSTAATSGARAQAPDPLTAKFSKAAPVQLVYHRPNGTFSAKQTRKGTNFSTEESQEILRRSADRANWPPAFANASLTTHAELKDVCPRYTAYSIGTFRMMGYGFVLVWLPQEENGHMPEKFRLPTKQGYVFWTSSDDVSSTGKDQYGKMLAKAGTAPGESGGSGAGGIQHSTADMSGLSASFQGCLAFTYSGMGYLDVVPVYGRSFNTSTDAPEIARRYDMATSYHKYQWHPGRSAASLEKEFGRSMTVRVLERYTVE